MNLLYRKIAEKEKSFSALEKFREFCPLIISSSTKNVLPCPDPLDSAQILPPWASKKVDLPPIEEFQNTSEWAVEVKNYPV
ncbi:MAG: hypothetical protein AAB567_00490 [Patescibacteria group bacterium]